MSGGGYVKLPRIQFGVRALLIGVAGAAVALWAWPHWQRHRALRSLNAAVEGAWSKSAMEVKGPPGKARNELPDYTRLKAVAAGVVSHEATDDAVELLVAQLQADDARVRTNAAIALGQLGPAAQGAVPELLDLLDDETVVAASSVHALAEVGDGSEDMVHALTNVLLDKERYPPLRYSAAVALGKFGVFDAVLEVIEKEETQWAPNVFGHIGARSKEAFPAIAELCNSPDPRLRCVALNALAGMAPYVKEAARLIEASKDDDDPSVRDAAVGALTYVDLVKRNTAQGK
jgi:HEAT repeat protein